MVRVELPTRIYTAPFFPYAGGVLMADDLLFFWKPVSAVFSVPFLSKRLAVGQRATMRVIGEIGVSGGAAKMARLAMECEAELSLPDELPALEPGQLLTADTPLLSTPYHEFSALAKALGGGDIVLLQGPPGTGKTTVIVEIIRQLVSRGERVLVSAQARAAVENIYNKLKSLNDGVGAEQGQMLRVAYNRNEADWQVSTNKGDMLFLLGDNVELLGKLRVGSKKGPLSEEEAELLCSVRSYDKKSEMPRLHKRVARQYASNAAGLEVRKVQKVLERLAEQLACVEMPPDRFAKELCLANIQVVCGTCVGLGVDTEIKRMTFDTVIIDEAGKANYAETIVPMSLGRRYILVGDHNQLPPYLDRQEVASFVKDKESRLSKWDGGRQYGGGVESDEQDEEQDDVEGDISGSYQVGDVQRAISRSLFEDFLCSPKFDVRAGSEQLNVQYRMDPGISALISKLFYKGSIGDSESVLRRVPLSLGGDRQVLFYPTDELRPNYELALRGGGYRNECEADLIARDIASLLIEAVGSGLTVGVISPYSA